MSSALERQIKPIYDALDSGSNKSAIVACNKLLKKSPKHDHIKALKALALVRMQKLEESQLVCDDVLAAKPSDDNTLATMNHALRGLGRNADVVKMFEEAFKQQPTNEELGCQAFLASVRVANWKSAQQSAMKLQKQFGADRYVFWNVMSCYLQAKDASTPTTMRPVLLKLAHRLLTSTNLGITTERFHLHLTVLKELELWEEADILINSEAGKLLCPSMLACEELRREIVRARGSWQPEGDLARARILENKDRNWLEFLAVLDATFPPTTSESAPNMAKEDIATAIQSARDLFMQVMEIDGLSDRSGCLALIELEKRARDHGAPSDPNEMVNLMKNYFNRVGSKPCCFEDLKPYLSMDADLLAPWTKFLQNQPQKQDSIPNLHRVINTMKCLRYNLHESEITAQLESARALEYTSAYLDGLTLGLNLPEAEYQPADDLASLAAHAFVNVANLTKTQEPLYAAVSLLEYGLTRSKESFNIHLALIRLYHLLCAPSLALEHYRALSVKQVQTDTLSHLILARASAFSLAAMGDITLMTEIVEASQIYISNSQDTPEWIGRAFAAEKYSQIPDFLDFHDRLERSLQRDLAKVELMRMRLAHEPITSDFIDMELIELKFNFDRFHHDNRDLEVVPNYQPRCQPSFNRQTELFHGSQGLDWLWVFMKSYIRALQQGSDLDDVVEEKLLIGDRPKLSNDPENAMPLKERVLLRDDRERKDLSEAEDAFYTYCICLADWLGPHHDFIRPPPEEVLAQASKLNEVKTGRPLKGYAPSANGSHNGHTKKDEDAPLVKEAPSYATEFFKDMEARFEAAHAHRSACDALHVATITQEALAVLTIETLRFKPSSIGKMYKLGSMVQSIKDIRAQAIAVLKTMSNELVSWAEQEGTEEKRSAFVSACHQLPSTSITHDFILNVAKNVTDARKKVLDGVGQGILKVCANHA